MAGVQALAEVELPEGAAAEEREAFSQFQTSDSRLRLRERADVISGQHILEGDYNMTGRGMGYLTGPADFGRTSPIVKRWTEKPKAFADPGDVLVTRL